MRKESEEAMRSLIDILELSTEEIDELVEKTFQGSIPAFIAAFTKRKKLSGEEVEEIRRMLDRYEDGEDPERQALSEQKEGRVWNIFL